MTHTNLAIMQKIKSSETQNECKQVFFQMNSYLFVSSLLGSNSCFHGLKQPILSVDVCTVVVEVHTQKIFLEGS